MLNYGYAKRNFTNNIPLIRSGFHISFFKKHWPMLTVMVFYLCIQMLDANTLPGHDPASYFYKTLKIADNFKTNGFAALKGLSMAAHPSHGYALIMAIPQFFFYGSVTALNITTFILCASMLWCTYHLCLILFSEHIKKGSTWEAALTSALVGFCPLIFASSIHMQLDFGSMIFLSWLLYAFWSDKKVFTVISALLLMFSKETGVLLYCAFGLSLLLFVFPQEFRTKTKFGFILPAIEKYYALLIPLTIFLIYYLCSGGFSWGGGITTTSENEWNYFGVDPKFIFEKLFQLFIMNWQWFFSIPTITIFIYLLLKRQRKALSPLVKSLLTIFIVFALFNCFYITAAIPRYWMPGMMLSILLGAYAFLAYMPKSPVRLAFLICWLLVYLIGNYTMLDPVTLKTHQTYWYGDQRFFYPKYGPNEFSSMTLYNRQYLAQERLYERLYTETGSHPDDEWIGLSWSWSCNINGNAESKIPLYVNANTLTRTFINTGHPVKYTFFHAQQLEDLSFPVPEQARWVRYTWLPEWHMDLMKLRYNLSEPIRIEQNGYYFDVYECVAR